MTNQGVELAPSREEDKMKAAEDVSAKEMTDNNHAATEAVLKKKPSITSDKDKGTAQESKGDDIILQKGIPNNAGKEGKNVNVGLGVPVIEKGQGGTDVSIVPYLEDGSSSEHQKTQEGVQPTVLRRSAPHERSHALQPGAYPAGGSPRSPNVESDEESVVDDASTMMVPSRETSGAMSRSTSGEISVETSGLVEARQVTEESERQSLQEAQELEEHQQVNPKRKKEEKWEMPICFAIWILCVIIVIGVVAGILVRRNKSSSDDQAVVTPSPTRAQSPSPSQVPSSAPTGVLDDLQILLPNKTLESIERFGTPQNKAWQWLGNHPNITNLQEWRKEQLFAMATFFYAFEGEQWFQLIQDDWLDDEKEECLWFSSGIGAYQLNETTGEYKYIEWDKDFEKNPPCNDQGKLTSLYVQDLKLNGLTPTFPPEIAMLTSLSLIDLAWNNLEMPLVDLFPTEFYQMGNLRDLILYVNDLTGTIPTELCQMTNLTTLHFSTNQLTGALPSQLGLMESLSVLGLYGDELMLGTLPTELGMMKKMAYLQLGGGGAFTGTIPSQFGQMESLLELYLSDLSLLTGPIPSELAGIENLGFVDILGCSGLTGIIPEGFCYLQNSSCTYEVWWGDSPCFLSFDCTDTLCGCDCSCTNSSLLMDPLGLP